LTNGTSADADQVMQNFNDLLNGVTDGTKDLSISALTAAGTTTLNGAVNLGNATADDITITGSLASTIPIKTTNTYNIGSSTLGLAGIYFGANSQTVRLLGSGSMSATWSMTLPVSAGSAGQGLQTNGSGVTSWQPMQTDISAQSADYTILDTDGFAVIEMTTSSTNRTVTLPTAADNTDRRIRVVKADSGTGTLTLDGESAETISGSASFTVLKQYGYIEVYCNGTSWTLTQLRDEGSFTPSYTGGGSSGGTQLGRYVRVGSLCSIETSWTSFTTDGTDTITFTLPFAAKNTSTFATIFTNAGTVGAARFITTAGSTAGAPTANLTTTPFSGVAANNTISINVAYEVDD